MSNKKRKYLPNNLHIVTVGTAEITTQKEDGTYNYHIINREVRVVGGAFYRWHKNDRTRYYFDSITDEVYDDTPEGINLLSDGTTHRIILDKCPLLDKYDIALDEIVERDLEAIIHHLNNPEPKRVSISDEITDLVLLTILAVYAKISTLIISEETKQNIICSLTELATNYSQDLTKLSIHHGQLPALDKLNLQKTYLNKIIAIETQFIERSHHENIHYQLANFKKRLK